MAVKRRILIVEDDAAVCTLLAQTFSSAGFQALTAANPATALFKLTLTQPDLIVLDLLLSGADGGDTLQRIRRLSSVPVIVLTSLDDIDLVVASLDGGADDALAKPFHAQELLARTRALLRRAQKGVRPADTPADLFWLANPGTASSSWQGGAIEGAGL